LRELREKLRKWKPVFKLMELPRKSIFSKGNNKYVNISAKQRIINEFLQKCMEIHEIRSSRIFAKFLKLDKNF